MLQKWRSPGSKGRSKALKKPSRPRLANSEVCPKKRRKAQKTAKRSLSGIARIVFLFAGSYRKCKTIYITDLFPCQQHRKVIF
jgi:hypothetical protein